VIVRACTAALVLLSALATINSGTASAQTTELDADKATAANLAVQIQVNGEKLGQLDELANQAQLELDQAKAASVDAQHRIDDAASNAEKLRVLLVRRAVMSYELGGVRAPVAGIDTTSVTDFQIQTRYTAVANERDQTLVAQYKRAEQRLAVAKRQYDQHVQEAAAQRDALAKNRADAAALYGVQTQLLAQVQGRIATLVHQDQAAQAASDAAASQQRLAQLTANTTNGAPPTGAPTTIGGAGAGTTGGGAGGGTPTGSTQPAGNGGGQGTTGAGSSANTSNPSVPPPPPSTGAQVAVTYAYKQLGKPYCYAGIGPDCYDCSGLTMMSWAQAGVTMPHGSIAQGDIFPKVPTADMQPGDLVIEYADHSHVSIYVGNGMMITAPHTGDFIKLVPVFADGWGFQYAVRP
jgi:cell wall-associated NlpC family hydrolase